jgi:mannose-6-phosphate isomerase-like protein (cupin superfamily)
LGAGLRAGPVRCFERERTTDEFAPPHRPNTMSEAADFVVLERHELPGAELEGGRYGGARVCLIFVDAAPGEGPRLHQHPYEEVFIILEGQPRFTVGQRTLDARPGQVLIVRPHVAHKFVNAGAGRLRQIDVHASPRFETEWLE